MSGSDSQPWLTGRVIPGPGEEGKGDNSAPPWERPV